MKQGTLPKGWTEQHPKINPEFESDFYRKPEYYPVVYEGSNHYETQASVFCVQSILNQKKIIWIKCTV